jgi:hypothetical protein
MDGHISRQSSSYRQGLVLGLTMAAFRKREQAKRQEAEQQLRSSE